MECEPVPAEPCVSAHETLVGCPSHRTGTMGRRVASSLGRLPPRHSYRATAEDDRGLDGSPAQTAGSEPSGSSLLHFPLAPWRCLVSTSVTLNDRERSGPIQRDRHLLNTPKNSGRSLLARNLRYRRPWVTNHEHGPRSEELLRAAPPRTRSLTKQGERLACFRPD